MSTMTARTETTPDTQAEPETPATDAPVADLRIVVLQRGWVVIGAYHRDGDEITITDASVIRRWGTTKGLGQLAAGPRDNTVLDAAGTVRAHALAVVMTIDADPAGWTK